MSDDGHFQCPACGKRFRWKSQIAGRKVRCTGCNFKMRTPQAVGGAVEPIDPLPQQPPADEDSYELSLDDDVAGPASRPAPAATSGGGGAGGKCPSCNNKVKPGAVICINCGFDLQAGRKVRTRIETAEDGAPPAGNGNAGSAAPLPPFAAAAALGGPRSGIAAALEDREDDTGYGFSDRALPLIFIVVGIIGMIGGGIWLTGEWNAGLMAGLFIVGMELVIMLPLLLISVFVSARLQGISFGYIGRAMLKLVSICIGPGAWGDVAAMLVLPFVFGIFGKLGVLFLIYLIFLGIPLSFMFDLDSDETIKTIAIVIAVRLVAFLFLLTTLFTVFM